jgi:hypothetical protein
MMRFIAKKHPRGFYGVWDKQRNLFVLEINNEPIGANLEYTVTHQLSIPENLARVTHLADRPFAIVRELNGLKNNGH